MKNEEKNIQQWLSCMKDIADEMIVVDTGSGDRTVELAKAGGARVYHFKWRNDFSAAKNYALDRATGDWIFFLDADEYFSESTRKRIRSLLERAHGNHRIIGINSTLYNIDVDRNNEINSTAIQQRIFRRNKHLRYEGRIHEYLVYHGKKTMDFAMSDIVIYHTGYSSGLTRKKNIRNLLLILLDVQAQGSVTEKHYSYLSVTYFNLLQYDKAI
ncbi:MAG: glycosyltransferase family 2 protein, partial [Selenomonadaceae bacterium]|nr:glycosyltransferase family 2 protein [Selenomonadaceae bacterium]